MDLLKQLDRSSKVFLPSVRYVSVARMRISPLSKGWLAVWSPTCSHVKANASRLWRPPLWGRSTIRCTSSSIKSGRIPVGENEGIIYVNSELQIIGSYYIDLLTNSRYISAPVTMAAPRLCVDWDMARKSFNGPFELARVSIYILVPASFRVERWSA